jgi:glycine dehydrogenase subunit 1
MSMTAYIPHTEEDIASMLAEIGVPGLDALFADIPERLLLKELPGIPEGLPEYDVYRRLRALAAGNRIQAVSYLGCGSYDHLIPAVVGHILARSEFYTSYTPYQAEISQGILQVIFEFQTMMCELTGLEASNASLYDGHTAACEAASLALNSVRKSDTILYSQTLHPFTRRVLRTHFSNLEVKLEEIPARNGVTDRDELASRLRPGVAGVILQSPNYLGCVEDFRGVAARVHENGSRLILSADPLALGLLKPAGEWGADVAIGDTQPLGLPSYFGGPSVGYITATVELLRKMPGRIAGQSLDREGKRAFLLTLQAREQHIKRERATSNICSNQALAALATTVCLAALGPQGIRELAEQNLQKAHYLYELLLEQTPVRPLFEQPFFNEFALLLPGSAATVLRRMEQEGFFAGVELSRLEPSLPEGALLVAVTEKRTREEIEAYAQTLRKVLS